MFQMILVRTRGSALKARIAKYELTARKHIKKCMMTIQTECSNIAKQMAQTQELLRVSQKPALINKRKTLLDSIQGN